VEMYPRNLFSVLGELRNFSGQAASIQLATSTELNWAKSHER
jgi:hypothetical protein